MAPRQRKTWKQTVTSDPGYARWTFGSKPRDVNKDPGKLVSLALKREYSRYTRFVKAREFAKRMWANYWRVREHGCRDWRLGGQESPIPFRVLDAMSMGVGAGHRLVMMDRYKKAAQAAERFCRR